MSRYQLARYFLEFLGYVSITIYGSGLPTTVWAGGLELYEMGTPGLGLAAAGEAVRAQDASTVFTNPAGMTRLSRSELLFGAQALYGDAHFDRNINTTVDGSASGNPVGFFPGGSFFYVHSLSDDFKVGFGSFSYFGMPLDWANNWSGRYYGQDSSLLGLSLMPSVAYKASDQLSFGVGFNAMYGIMQQQLAVNNLDPTFDDGKLEIDDETWGFGADVGIMYEFSKESRVGLRYVSEVSLDFKDTPELTDLGPIFSGLLSRIRVLDLGMTVPTDLTASIYHQVSPAWAILASGGWQDWSRFGAVEVSVTSPNSATDLTTDIHTKDTWHASLGLQNRSLDEWILSAGVAYDSSMFDDEDRPVTIPVGEVWRFGIGAQYMVDTDITLGCAYELAYAGDMKVDQERGPLAGRIAGEYDNTFLHYWGLSLQYKL